MLVVGLEVNMIQQIFLGMLVLGLFALFGYLIEKRLYNKGICPNCGTPLRYFDTDSQGGRGYICDSCKYCIWVSYPFIEVKDEYNR